MAQESPHAKAQYTEAQARKLLEQLQCYSAAKGFSQGRMASMLDISSSSLSNLMHGGYAGNEDAHLAKIEQFLDREAERAEKPGLTSFVETSVALDIFKTLRQNHVHGTMGAVIGNSGVGKTRAFRQYALQNENVIILTASTWMRSHVQLSKKLGEILGVDKKKRNRTQERCGAIVEELLGASRLIIIDQAHQLREDAHEFLQNLWDQCNPTEEERRLGIVLGCTWKFYNQIYDEKAVFAYEQLTSRIDAGMSKKIPQSPFTINDIKKLFSTDNVKFQLSDAALGHLHRVANSAGGLRTAVANVEHLQDLLNRQKAPANTAMSVDMLKQIQQIMLRKAA